MNSIHMIQEGLRDIVRPNILPNLLNIGVTGSIGSGKSSVVRILHEYGAAIIDMDVISRRITASGGSAIELIRETFGSTMIDSTGALDRAKMRELVFRDATTKKQLEAITHPLISQEAVRQAHQAIKHNPICIVYDIPLLVGNTYWLEILDWVIGVICERDVQISRVLQRNPEYSLATVEAILNNQTSNEVLSNSSNLVIDNTQDRMDRLHDLTRFNILVKYIQNLSKIKSTLQ